MDGSEELSEGGFVKCQNCGNVKLSRYYIMRDTVKVPKDSKKREIVLATTSEMESLMPTESYVCDECGAEIDELN